MEDFFSNCGLTQEELVFAPLWLAGCWAPLWPTCTASCYSAALGSGLVCDHLPQKNIWEERFCVHRTQRDWDAGGRRTFPLHSPDSSLPKAREIQDSLALTHVPERLGVTCQLSPTGILAGVMQVTPNVPVVPSQTLVSWCWAVLSARQQMQLCMGAGFHAGGFTRPSQALNMKQGSGTGSSGVSAVCSRDEVSSQDRCLV